MTTKMFVCGIASAALLLTGIACSSDDDGTGGSGGSATGTGTGTGTGSDGGGGTGGSATGAGGSGEGGAGGSASCATCSEFFESGGTLGPDETCGFQSFDMGMLTCDPDSSCSLLADFLTCACVTSCAAACGDNGCMGMTASTDCIACTDTQCSAETAACDDDKP